jgi:hypothetical protein
MLKLEQEIENKNMEDNSWVQLQVPATKTPISMGKKKLGVVAHTCNPSTEADAAGSQVRGQLGLHSKFQG